MRSRGVPQELFDRLTTRWPSPGGRRVFFRLEGDVESAAMTEALAMIETFGVDLPTSWPAGSSAGVEICLARSYTPSDLRDHHYLWFLADPVDEQPVRNAEGLIVMDALGLQSPGHFRCPHGFAYADVVVPTRVKSGLEATDLKGLSFRPVAKADGGLSNEWWELTSEVSLPPLSPSQALSDGPKGYWVTPREGLYFMAELRYRKEDLAALPPFDLAVTHERMFGSAPSNHPKVASQRFYHVCEENGWDTNWVPVHLE